MKKTFPETRGPLAARDGGSLWSGPFPGTSRGQRFQDYSQAVFQERRLAMLSRCSSRAAVLLLFARRLPRTCRGSVADHSESPRGTRSSGRNFDSFWSIKEWRASSTGILRSSCQTRVHYIENSFFSDCRSVYTRSRFSENGRLIRGVGDT